MSLKFKFPNMLHNKVRNLFPNECQKNKMRCGLPPINLEPYTTSAWPSKIGFNNKLNSCGSHSKSASCIIIKSPLASFIPLCKAAPFP